MPEWRIKMADKLHIRSSAEGKKGRLEIDGDISEWNENNSAVMKQRCAELKESGVTSVLIYLCTYGGDCFQANEMVNILNDSFPNGYDGEGGAIVASAGTYLAVNCKKFDMARNGQFMIHKPSGYAWGNEQEMQNYLKLLQNMTATYHEAYMSRCKKTKAEFDAKWNGGDFWMTAKEAEEWGFVTGVKEPATITPATAQAIKACGAPIQHPVQNVNQHTLDMDIKVMAVAIGMSAETTQEQFTARMVELKAKADQFDALKAQVEQDKKTAKEASIKAKLDKAESEKKFTADARKSWEVMMELNEEAATQALEKIQPVAKIELTSGRKGSETTVSADGKYNGKTFEQLQDEDPEMLAKLEDEDPEAFEALFASWKKRNKV
jgi:ATP-dependent protease ClpP protease subunit